MPFGTIGIAARVFILIRDESLKRPIVAESHTALRADMGVSGTIKDVKSKQLITRVVPKGAKTGVPSLTARAKLPS